MPGYSTYVIKPQLGNLTWATLQKPALVGDLLVSVHQTDANFMVNVTNPANVLATVCVPKLGSSSLQVVVDGRKVAGHLVSDYVCVANIGSGPHQVSRF